MAKVVLENIWKRYGDVEVVKDFNFTVHDKELVVLVGPSGCGKSTTLRMIAGLEEISEGSIYIGDRRVNDVAPKDRDIAMVFQAYALYPHWSVYDNMAFALKLRKTPKEEVKSRVLNAAKILEIDHLLDRKPKALSGGQRQRVAMGRAIVRDPSVFLFDEPLSNLDAKLRVQMRVEISKLHNRLQTTIVYVTHDQVEAMTLADRIVIMNDGRIQQAGTPLDVYERPANLFVATFIGSPSMNVLKGEYDGDNLVVGGTPIEPTAKQKSCMGSYRGDITLGVRPQHVSVADGGRNTVQARVEVVEHLGSEKFVYLKIGEQPLTARLESQDHASEGQEQFFAFDMDQAHIFDAEGLNLLLDDTEVTK